MSNHQENPAQTATAISISGPRSLLEVLRVAFVKYKHSHQQRKLHKDARTAFMTTLRLDDKMLKDIGVTREEAEWAATLPLEINAAKALHARARSRRQDEASQPRLGCRRSCVINRGLSARDVIALRPSRTVLGSGFH